MVEILFLVIGIPFAMCMAHASHKASVEQKEYYLSKGLQWCIEELQVCTYGPHKVLLRDAIRKLRDERDENERPRI